MLPLDLAGWGRTSAGAFIAFFAFIGFETLANLAEETKDPAPHPAARHPRRDRGKHRAVCVGATAAVLSDSVADRPLLDIFAGAGVWAFATVGFLAVGNGTLVQIVMLARLFYGMARNATTARAVRPRASPHRHAAAGDRARRMHRYSRRACWSSFEQLLVLPTL